MLPLLPAATATPDLVLLGLLLLFVLWGVVRGPWRQAASLALLTAAFPIANRLGPGLEEVVQRAVTVDVEDLPCIAWGAAFLVTLVAGGLLFALLRPLLKSPQGRGRGLGAALGLLHGLVFLSIVGYGLMMGFSSDERPGWVRALESSHGAKLMRYAVLGVSRLADLPPALDERRTGVDRRIEAGD